MQECKVLFLEDSLGDARLVHQMLADAANSLFAFTPPTAWWRPKRAGAAQVDVALVDLGLADSHGLETLLTLQRHAPGLPIVALTGLDSESTALAAVERGAQDCLVKGTLKAESLVVPCNTLC